MPNIALFINFLISVFCIYMLFRNYYVFKIQGELIDTAFKLSQETLHLGAELKDIGIMHHSNKCLYILDKKIFGYSTMMIQFNMKKYYFDLYQKELAPFREELDAMVTLAKARLEK